MLEPIHHFRDWLNEPKVRRRTLLGGIVAAAGVGSGAMLAAEHYRDPEEQWEDLDGDTLTILSGQDESSGQQREALVSQWNKLHGSHQAVWKHLPRNADLQYNGIHSALQSQDSQYDLVNLDIPWITEFAGRGYLRPLDGIEGDQFLSAPFRTGLVDGRVYALPFNTDVGLLYYRKDVLRAVNPEAEEPDSGEWDPAGWDWDEFVRKARELWANSQVKAAVRSLEGGIAMQLARYEGLTVNVWEVLLSRGAAPIGDDPTRFDIEPDTMDVFEDLRNLINNEVILSDSLEYEEAASLEAFKQGRTIFLRHWPNAYRQLMACDTMDFKVGIAPLPGTGVLGGQSLAVTSASQYPVVARALAEFLTNARSQQLLFERGGFAPARPEPYEDAYLRGAPSPTPTPTASATATATPSEEPTEATPDCVDSEEAGFPPAGVYALDTGLDEAGQRPAVDHYNRFSEVFRDSVHDALSGREAIDPGTLETELEKAVEGK